MNLRQISINKIKIKIVQRKPRPKNNKLLKLDYQRVILHTSEDFLNHCQSNNFLIAISHNEITE